MSFKYLLYGLHVESELEIEEAYAQDFDGEPDVKVVYGDLPNEVKAMYKDKMESDFFVATTRSAMAFRIPDVGDYWVTENIITIKPFENAAEEQIKCFLLGSSFGYCMILRNMVVMHGGGISKYGKGVIVTGESGAGKSTVSDSLLDMGYKFIADDVCALTDNGSKAHINMAYPQQKLCRDAALNRGYNLEDLIYINEDRDKFALRLKDGYLVDGKDFDYLFELVVSDSDELDIREVKGQEKLSLLMKNIYRGSDGFHSWGVPPMYMKQCLKVASTIKVYQIARPKAINTLPDIIGFIDKCVQEGA
ncbi:dephospho-CoA kinase [Pseudobutyrivibrio xylanivorans]|uniref:Dephospho-CoA kinase n=1 Tax=Pseudobutyrivibrio xylanivorans TaxID=185007 RepID=A0A5P6VVJ5_PSEXY|nr:dephospho-CoA kinase [Pseudobutyrivibrio xylanivorans]QFJ56049.1 dephospho-CoA kinase [Pseudobutyrivibrio xylanivorans]